MPSIYSCFRQNLSQRLFHMKLTPIYAINILLLKSMFQLFSSEFLNNLRDQVKNKAKTSKALLQAIKDLSITNQNNKKRLSELQTEMVGLKNQNLMLMQILESTKKDYASRIQLKDKKISDAIEIEAKLFAENEGLKNEIQRLKQEIQVLKTSCVFDKNLENQYKNDGKQKSVTQVISNNSQFDLNAYLFSQRDNKTQKSINQIENQKEIDIPENKIENQSKTRQRSGHKSQYQLNKFQTKNQMFYSQILHEENENE